MTTDRHGGEPPSLPRSREGAKPQHLIVTLFGDYWLGRYEHLPSSALVALAGEFGISVTSARAALGRLARRGLLTPSKVGRRTFYGANPEAQRELSRGRDRILSFGYARDIVARRRSGPIDPHDDLVTALLIFSGQEPGLDDEFAAGSLRQLFIAAHVAPRVAMAAAIVCLAQDQDLQARLRAEAALMPAAVEEMLRLHAPNQGYSDSWSGGYNGTVSKENSGPSLFTARYRGS